PEAFSARRDPAGGWRAPALAVLPGPDAGPRALRTRGASLARSRSFRAGETLVETRTHGARHPRAVRGAQHGVARQRADEGGQDVDGLWTGSPSAVPRSPGRRVLLFAADRAEAARTYDEVAAEAGDAGATAARDRHSREAGFQHSDEELD